MEDWKLADTLQATFSNTFLDWKIPNLFRQIQLRTGAKPLPEPMVTQFIDAHMRHNVSVSGAFSAKILIPNRIGYR